jgi:hypothetical protein
MWTEARLKALAEPMVKQMLPLAAQPPEVLVPTRIPGQKTTLVANRTPPLVIPKIEHPVEHG